MQALTVRTWIHQLTHLRICLSTWTNKQKVKLMWTILNAKKKNKKITITQVRLTWAHYRQNLRSLIAYWNQKLNLGKNRYELYTNIQSDDMKAIAIPGKLYYYEKLKRKNTKNKVENVNSCMAFPVIVLFSSKKKKLTPKIHWQHEIQFH